MNIFENLIYSFSFLTDKYIGLSFTEYILNWYENRLINKYLSKEEISTQQIPTINKDELTKEIFIQLSNNYKTPVLIKGYLKDTEAVKKWDEKYLCEIINDFNLEILKKENNDLIVKDYNFNEFIEKVKTENIYLNNNSSIFYNFPEIFNDIKDKFYEFVNLLKNTGLRNIHMSHFFIGYNNKNKVSGTNMHCAGNGNFFCMIKGKKQWTFIDPKYSYLLKGRVAPSGIHAQTLCDMPDTEISYYPEIIKHIPRFETTLEPGDLLWNAPWWWHRIKNINIQENEYNIAIAIRNNKVSLINIKNNLLYTISGYTYLLYNSLFLTIYEKLFYKKHKNFNINDTKQKTNVLQAIKFLTDKYPNTIHYDDIISKNPKNK